MLCRLASTASRRAASTAGSPRQPALLTTSAVVVCGRPSSGAATATATATRQAPTAAGRLAAVPSGTRRLLSSTATAPASPNQGAVSATPKLVFGIPKEDDDVVRTPPVEAEDSGPVIREMRVQLRPREEYGTRRTRKIRMAGKVPGVVYSNSNTSVGGGRRMDEPILVKVDKIVLDREIRRLGASFDNTVYELVIEGAISVEQDAAAADKATGIDITVGDKGAGDGQVQGGEAEGDAPQPERRELVLANQTRLHPVFRTLLSVNWIRYKAGRRYPIPLKFINNDLNDNFRKGAYIRRLKTHQHIILPDDPEKVPKWLYVDLEFVRSGSKLRVSDLLMPEGIRLHRGDEPATWNEIVCTIKGRKIFESEEESAEDGK